MPVSKIVEGPGDLSTVDPNAIGGEFGEVNVTATPLASGTKSFNIQSFRATLPQGVARTNLFRVEISKPDILKYQAAQSKVTSIDSRLLSFLCSAGTIPGVRLTTTEVRRYGYGPTEKMPMSHAFEDITLYFIADGDGIMLKFFRYWMRGILEYNSEGSIGQVNKNSGPLGEVSPFFVNYKTDYRSQINIVSYHESGQYIADKVSLLNAYPVDIKDIQLNWADNNQLMLIPVTFTFFDFEEPSDIDTKFDLQPDQTGLSILQKIYKGITAAQTITSFKKIENIRDAVQIVRETSKVIKSIFEI